MDQLETPKLTRAEIAGTWVGIACGLVASTFIFFLFLVFAGAAAGNAGQTGYFGDSFMPIGIALFVLYVTTSIYLGTRGKKNWALIVAWAPLFFVFGFPILSFVFEVSLDILRLALRWITRAL